MGSFFARVAARWVCVASSNHREDNMAKQKLNDIVTELNRNAHVYRCEVKRGKAWVEGVPVDAVVDGVPIAFTRRRYGTATFTWCDAFIAGHWQSLGDPWQKVMPSLSDIRTALDMACSRT